MARVLPWVLLFALGTTGVALALAYWPCQIDDAFITYRYAVNAATQHALAYNVGGPAVEGFSSPLWFLLLTGCAAAFGKSTLPVAAATFGLLAFVGSIGLAAWIAARAVQRCNRGRVTWAAVLAGGLVALCPANHLYAITGLETVSFLLVTLAVAGTAAGILPLWPGMAAALLATWVRPEGPFLIVSILLPLVRERRRWRESARLAAALVAGTLALVILRWGVFGEFLPNTYYAKDPDFGRGLLYLRYLATLPWALLLTGTAVAGAIVGRGPFLHFALTGGTWLVALVLEGGDWMPLGRFALPTFGCFAIATSGLMTSHSRRVAASTLLSCTAIVTLSLLSTRDRLIQQHKMRRTYYHEGQRIADWLRRGQVRSVALMDIGVIGFETGIEVVDLAGLTDRRIARSAGHHLRKHLEVSYVLGERNPEVVIARVVRRAVDGQGRFDPDAAMSQPEYDLLASIELRARYRLAFELRPPAPRDPYYGLLVFVRSDVQLPPRAEPPGLFLSVEPLDS